jgi:hypothetical protein
MTDSSAESPKENEALERLVEQYEQGVADRETSDAATWLNARTEIESQWENLTDDQIERVESADGTLIENAGAVASRLAASGGGSLSAQRAATPRPPEQWWWYLDVLAHVSDYYAGEPEGAKAPPSLFSRLLTAVEVIVLAVAIFLLGRNLVPQIFPTPAPTAFPTLTPAPTETLNAAAFDMSAATPFKSQFGVIEMLVPKGWDITPETEPGQYTISYGQGNPDSSATIQILIGDPKTLYEQVLGVSASVASPQAALDAFKQNSPPSSGLVVGNVQPAKVGKLDGSELMISIPAGQQRPETQVDLRVAPLPDGKIVFVIVQASKSLWTVAQPVIEKMLDSLVANPQNIPTATPTITPHPLQLTQTAIQQTIIALTPTVTPTPAATGAATGAPTGAATSPATSAAPAPTTSAATPPASTATPPATAQF